MNLHLFQHVPFEGLGSIDEWISQNGHTLTSTRFYGIHKIPSVSEIDGLIIMGGPMSVHDEKEYPWLKPEKEFIHQAIMTNKMVIGVCLGAQLIADVLGAKVYPNGEKEIGWFPVRFAEHAKQTPPFRSLAPDFTVFHWHGDTFDLPAGAVHLASSEACINQAFLYKEKVLGLQFHLETTEGSLSQMIKHGNKELISGNYIQSERDILKGHPLINENKRVLFSILDVMTREIQVL